MYNYTGLVSWFILHIADFEVMVEYTDDGEYTLTAIGEEGKAGTPIQASCWVEEEGEEEEGAELDGDNLVMVGFLGEKRVIANVTTVDNKLHVFTNVSCHLSLSLSLSHSLSLTLSLFLLKGWGETF